MLITGLTPGDLDGLSHLAMTGEIAAKLAAWSPATIVAYNGLTFDEEHLRHALFATLHPPYLTQRPGNGRTDILVMARAIAALRPEALTVPLIDGKPSFKLGPRCRANGIDLPDAAAHDALHDVRATLALMKLLRERAPDLFAKLMANARKDVPAAMLREEALLVLCNGFGGPVPVAGIMASPTNPSAWLVADLSIDPQTYLGLPEAELAALFTAKGRRPFRNVKTNAQPALLRFRDAGHAIAEDATPEAELRRRAMQVRSDETLLARLRTVLAGRSPTVSRRHGRRRGSMTGSSRGRTRRICVAGTRSVGISAIASLTLRLRCSPPGFACRRGARKAEIPWFWSPSLAATVCSGARAGRDPPPCWPRETNGASEVAVRPSGDSPPGRLMKLFAVADASGLVTGRPS